MILPHIPSFFCLQKHKVGTKISAIIDNSSRLKDNNYQRLVNEAQIKYLSCGMEISTSLITSTTRAINHLSSPTKFIISVSCIYA